MLVKHPGLGLVVKMLVLRLQRCDDMAAKCIEMLDFLAFSRKFIRYIYVGVCIQFHQHNEYPNV